MSEQEVFTATDSQPDERLVYSIARTCRMLDDIHRATVYRMGARGELDLVKIGGRRMVTAKSLRRVVGLDGAA